MMKRWDAEAAQARKEKEEKIRKAVEQVPGSEQYLLQQQELRKI